MRLTRRLLAVVLGTVLTSTALTPAAAQAAQRSVQNCPPNPSWIAVAQANAAGAVQHGNKIDSNNPGGTVVINVRESDWRYVSHFGDVEPGTRAIFEYYNQRDELVRRHTTAFSRDNGVIHQEPEVRDLPWAPGTTLRVFAFWTDECDDNGRGIFLGYVNIVL